MYIYIYIYIYIYMYIVYNICAFVHIHIYMHASRELTCENFHQSGAIPSTFWTNDKLMMIYLMLYNFLCFMFMFNFIIGAHAC